MTAWTAAALEDLEDRVGEAPIVYTGFTLDGYPAGGQIALLDRFNGGEEALAALAAGS